MINKIWKLQTMRKSWMSKSTLFLSGCLLLLPTHKNFAAVEGGALVKGTTFTDDTSVVPASTASSKAIKWSSSDLDPSVFEIDASNPSRLKVKSAGDYFLAFTGPISEAVRAANVRSQVHFFVKKMEPLYSPVLPAQPMCVMIPDTPRAVDIFTY